MGLAPAPQKLAGSTAPQPWLKLRNNFSQFEVVKFMYKFENHKFFKFIHEYVIIIHNLLSSSYKIIKFCGLYILQELLNQRIFALTSTSKYSSGRGRAGFVISLPYSSFSL